MADLFRNTPGLLPSDLVPEEAARAASRTVLAHLGKAGVNNFGVRVHGTCEYPARLRDAADPLPLLYYQGWWDLINAPRTVAVVGTREITAKGLRRTRKLVSMLVNRKCVIVSGLSRGVDTVAHETAIECGGATIGVAGSPLGDQDPTANGKLQRLIAAEHLLLSPAPVLQYQKMDSKRHRVFFPERGKTMSALAAATIIVEAGEISGTVNQAEAALRQGRKLFILNCCFDRPDVTWPARLEAAGAVRVREFDQIVDALRERN
jgi:DNA processing protein